MEQVRYSGRRFAEVLGLSASELAEAEERGLVHSTIAPEGPSQKISYSVEDLQAARTALNRMPPHRPMRKQLFLNFKGGTGKTSVSTSYAFRLAEMGHRVLVIDLD
jgi:chromosome partitioning protein